MWCIFVRYQLLSMIFCLPFQIYMDMFSLIYMRNAILFIYLMTTNKIHMITRTGDFDIQYGRAQQNNYLHSIVTARV